MPLYTFLQIANKMGLQKIIIADAIIIIIITLRT
jgi:hypothetical protein